MTSQEAKLLSTVWVQASPAARDGKEPTAIGEMARSIEIHTGAAQRLAESLQQQGYWTLWYSDSNNGPVVQFTEKGIEFVKRPPAR